MHSSPVRPVRTRECDKHRHAWAEDYLFGHGKHAYVSLGRAYRCPSVKAGYVYTPTTEVMILDEVRAIRAHLEKEGLA